MKIMIVGVCDIESSTNTFMAQGFRNLGHKVICYNYRTRLKLYYGNQGRLEEDFIETLKAIDDNGGIDLIIFCKTDTMPITAMSRASKYARTFYWFMDPITTANIMMADLRAASCYAASATCMEVVDFFKKTGQPNSYKINEGADLDIFKPLKMKKKYDVLFFGSPTQERSLYLESLINSGITVKVFGDGWNKKFSASHPIYNANLVSEINQAKIILNVSRTDSYSDRVTLAMASGAFVITCDISEIHIDFIVGKHLETFLNIQELQNKVTYYLNNEQDRSKVAVQGCALVRSRSGWETVCLKILERITDFELF